MLQRLSDLWCTHNGAEGFDCFIIGKVSSWGQIRPQDTLSVPQSPFDHGTFVVRIVESLVVAPGRDSGERYR